MQDIGISTLPVALSTVNRGGAVQSVAIVIRFAEIIVLSNGLRPNGHRRITAEHEYAFSTEVQTKDASELLAEIKRFRPAE